ncbi:uncharacterized protein LOC130725367 [Lotus japonicus]|uniref:uncharacterized protein LOC130725367 n=1 Tax=Lotus japonicus TaxID=34305 RepID=UPI00258CF5AF|nr:uncharacterized protein LOC130725367 [Lotus japonicus]
MESIKHFSHIHPLQLKEDHQNDVEQVFCSGCEKPISGPVFCCNQCNYVLHKSCAELPNKKKHPFHPEHHLTLLSTPPYEGICICDACRGIFNKFVYHCSLCKFDLDIACASQWNPDDGHKHAFISLWNPTSPFVCYACGEKASEILSCVCSICQIWVHSSCADYWDTTTKKDEVDTESDQSQDIDFSLFCHEHLLRFVEEQSLQNVDDKIKLCDGCIQPIITSSPFFSCSENCGFVLHQSCAELPKTKKHPFHIHHLSLLPKAPPYDGVFRCDGCRGLSNGFVYRCDECQFDLDVCCGSLKDTIEHESHNHPLHLEKTGAPRICKGCHLQSNHVYVCHVCEDFAIDCGCATLPNKAWHVFGKHPLKLTCFAGTDLRGNECGICSEKMSLEQWFYFCDDCDFAAHTHCVVGKCWRVKFGGTFKYDTHSHPLALVEETRKNTACEACDEQCNGLALECGQCKSYYHREGKCFWEQFKESAKYFAFSGTMLRYRYAANVFAATPNVTTKGETKHRK